ncbi:uncharacterized protein LOC111126129 isoform X2 [Crassostrea virginica]
MAGTTICSDTSEAVELCKAQGLYLKPIAKLTVCVQLPKLKEMGKSISNWEVMEKIKHMAKPHSFISLKIIKSTMEFMRLEGEAETKVEIKAIIQCLDSRTIKLSGFPEVLKVKAAEAKVSHPSQHDWDSFFRDAKNMNEMKPGERPDTVHVKDLPTKWFSHRKKDRLSEQVVKRVFENFGEVRCLDIPMLDPYRKEMTSVKSSGLQTFNYNTGITFDVYVQYKEYISFVKAMDSLRGMKLLYIADDEEEKAYTANMRVEFDKTKHLSDKSIKKRRMEREKLEQLEREREEKVRREREEEEKRVEEEKRKKEEEEREKERKRIEKIEKRESRRQAREEKRRLKALERKRLEEEKKYQMKIQMEERRFLIAQRKLESIRLLGELFSRIKAVKVSSDLVQREIELEEERRNQVEEEKRLKEEMKKRKLEAKKRRKEELLHHETELREKILKNWKEKEEKKEEAMRERLRQRLRGKKVLKSAAVKPSVSNMTTSSEVRPAPSPPDWRQRGEEWIREEYENKVLQRDRVNKFKGHGKQKVPRFYKSLHNNPHMEWKKRLKQKEVEMRRWKEWNEWKKQFLYWKHKFSFPVPYME